MGNISKAFQLATTKEEATKKIPHKSLQDVTTFKGQLQQLQMTNQQDALTIQHLQFELEILEGAQKRVQELEIGNSNFWNELPKLHKQLTKIDKTLGSINLEHVVLQTTL